MVTKQDLDNLKDELKTELTDLILQVEQRLNLHFENRLAAEIGKLRREMYDGFQGVAQAFEVTHKLLEDHIAASDGGSPY